MPQTYDATTLKRLGGPQSGQIVDLVRQLLEAVSELQERVNAVIEDYNTANETELALAQAPVPRIVAQ